MIAVEHIKGSDQALEAKLAIARMALAQSSAKADELRQKARSLLVEAVADAHQLRMTQREISQSLGRSQPEVSRLLGLSAPRFRASSPLGVHLVLKRAEIIRTAEEKGATNVRVFGSLARGEDGPDSDIDLFVDMPSKYTLMDLAAIQVEFRKILNHSVDVVPANDMRRGALKTALTEAVAL